MADTVVKPMHTTLMSSHHFQQVFHHCSRLILHTARPATRMALVGAMMVIIGSARQSAVTAPSGLRPTSSVSGPKIGMVSAAKLEELGTKMVSRFSTT